MPTTQTPIPETDAAITILKGESCEPDNTRGLRQVVINSSSEWVSADFARKLERERDEARLENKSWKQLHDADEQCINNQLAELVQLRKVCDDWHITAMTIMESSNDIHAACERLKPLMKQHSTLPHVIKAKETKPDDMYESLTSDEEFNGH